MRQTQYERLLPLLGPWTFLAPGLPATIIPTFPQSQHHHPMTTEGGFSTAPTSDQRHLQYGEGHILSRFEP